MNKLSALVSLRSRITVYVPATVSVDQEIDSAAYAERVAHTLFVCFGGAATSLMRGCWASDSGELAKETTAMVFTYCSTTDAEKYIDDVASLCYGLKREMGQEAITLEYNGEIYFI